MDWINVGVIGTGAMGKNHIRIYNDLKTVNAVYIYDIDEKSMRDIEDFYDGMNCDVYACDTLKSLVDACDAISICVPTQYHKSTIQSLIEDYKYESHLLIEKPICSTSKEAIDVAKLLSKPKYNLVYGVGHVERFNPIVPELKKIIKDPLYVEFKRHNPSSLRMIGTDVIEDLMVHDIDIMREIIGKSPLSIHGNGNHNVFSADIMIRSTPVHLSASRKSSKKIRSIYIEMEEFTIDADYMSQEITIYSKPDRYKLDNDKYVQENLVEKVMVTKKEPLKEELTTFVKCAFYNESFPVSIEDAINSMLICDDLKTYLK